jgi:CheY-like chemotaxis protein
MFRILIIDPNDPFRQSLKKVLVNRFPYVEIQETSDGSEGLKIMQAFNPNLIYPGQDHPKCDCFISERFL